MYAYIHIQYLSISQLYIYGDNKNIFNFHMNLILMFIFSGKIYQTCFLNKKKLRLIFVTDTNFNKIGINKFINILFKHLYLKIYIKIYKRSDLVSKINIKLLF